MSEPSPPACTLTIMMKKRVIEFAVLLIGVILLAAGITGLVTYVGVPNAQTISGTQVLDLTQCSNGYATGHCPVVTFDWSGTLVSPKNATTPGLPSIWGLTGDDTCGLPATYATNIPDSATGPMYLPIGSTVAGMTGSSSVAYAYTSARYTLADGCGGTNMGGASRPTPISVSYAEGSNTGTFSAVPFGNDFSLANLGWGGLSAGMFLTLLGAMMVFGGPGPRSSDAGRPSPAETKP
jgi:hypothetical protein